MNRKERNDRIMVNKGLLEAKAELNQGNIYRALLMVIKGSHIRAVDFIDGNRVIADFTEKVITENYKGASDYLDKVVAENKKVLNDDKDTD